MAVVLDAERTFTPVEPRPSPVRTTGAVPWMRANVFANTSSTIATVLIVALALYFIPRLIDCAILRAVFVPGSEACRTVRETAAAGALWPRSTASFCSAATRSKRSGAR